MGLSNWLKTEYGENEHGHFVHVFNSDDDWMDTIPDDMDEDDIKGDPDRKWVEGEGSFYVSREAAQRGFYLYCEWYEASLE